MDQSIYLINFLKIYNINTNKKIRTDKWQWLTYMYPREQISFFFKFHSNLIC